MSEARKTTIQFRDFKDYSDNLQEGLRGTHNNKKRGGPPTVVSQFLITVTICRRNHFLNQLTSLLSA
jgi:hypothetical protein